MQSSHHCGAHYPSLNTLFSLFDIFEALQSWISQVRLSTSTLGLVRPDKLIAVPATEFDGLITHIALIDVEVVEHLVFGRLGRCGC